jgi:hypothetical protein
MRTHHGLVSPDLRKKMTPIRQLEKLGSSPRDVRHIVLTRVRSEAPEPSRPQAPPERDSDPAPAPDPSPVPDPKKVPAEPRGPTPLPGVVPPQPGTDEG